ncbi:MAG: acyltransferase family protein [Microthrixaceae bacterium]
MSAPHHRADVQGLRAVAVLLVVAFHVGGSPIAQTRAGAGWALARSGFVGVDVFFVISGFVITALLLRGVDRGEGVPFRDFYARRARRIMPALALMTTVVLVACVVVLDPFGAQQFAARTAVAANAFVANVYLYRHTGYFDASAATNPFLHTWSLSVEEQTYLVLPAALALTVWFGRRRRQSTGSADPDRSSAGTPVAAVASGTAIVAVASFALAMALHAGWRPFGVEAPQRLAFLAAPTRWWEFAVGALVALAVRSGSRPGRAAAAALGIGGLVVVVGSGVLLDPGEAWPSAWTLVPVLGTAAVILAGASGPAGRLLSWRPLTWLGDRSYAWYLWHWPAIVLAVAVSPTTAWLPAAAAVGSLLPAWASYRWVERPIRVAPRIVGRRAALLGGGCVLITLVAAAAVLFGARGGWGLEEADGWYDLPNGRNVGCHQFNRDATGDWPAEVCTTPATGAGGANGSAGGRDTVLVLGDLQADGVAPATVDAAGSLGYRTGQWSRSGCPFLTRAPVHASGCEEWQRRAWELVERVRPAAVVLAADEAAYTTAAAPEEELAGPGGGHPGSTDAAVRSWAGALDGTLERLRGLGVGAVVVGGAPDLGSSFPRDRQSLLDPDPPLPTVDRRDAERRRADVWRAQQDVVDRDPGAALVDPVPLLCTPRCDAVADGRWRFYERNQLTNAGSAVLTGELRRALERVTSPGTG